MQAGTDRKKGKKRIGKETKGGDKWWTGFTWGTPELKEDQSRRRAARGITGTRIQQGCRRPRGGPGGAAIGSKTDGGWASHGRTNKILQERRLGNGGKELDLREKSGGERTASRQSPANRHSRHRGQNRAVCILYIFVMSVSRGFVENHAHVWSLASEFVFLFLSFAVYQF